MSQEAPKQVVAVRLAGYELYALDQWAEITGLSRTESVRKAIVDQLRHTMLNHSDWPVHPAWGDIGNDQWAITLFQHWAWAVTDADPAKHFEKVTLDGIKAYRLKPGRDVPKFQEWQKHIEKYHARQAKQGG